MFRYRREFDELDEEVMERFENCENQFIVSAESILEIANLLAVGRIEIPGWKTFDDVKKSVDDLGFEIRYVVEAHLKTFFKLRRAPGHNDPVDLVLLAQAITEKLPMISSDTDFPFYVDQGLELVFNSRRRRRRRG